MKKQLIYAVSFILGLIGPALAEEDQALIKEGRAVYLQHCARCHGNDARGKGMDADRLPVAPRNLIDEDYKFKSTEYGTPPSDEDLLWILNHGMAGAGMPSFANLSRDAKSSLIAYIKSISQMWGQYAPEPIEPPNEKLKPNLARGKEMWNTLQCALCHGASGRANGPSAATLTNPPANLAQGWRYRAGESPKQIYYRLTAGIAGSGMPSYQDAGFSKEDLWSLANYVASLQLETNWALQIQTKKVKGTLPSGYDDKGWDQAERTDINLQSNNYAGKKRIFTTVNAVSVQAVYNETEIAFRLSWDDPVKNEGRVSDALMLAFKPDLSQLDVRDNLHTLYGPKATPMNMIQWTAGQADVVTSDMGAAKNNLAAQAQYNDGQWQLVFSHPLTQELKEAISNHDTPFYVGFAAWDGEKGERFQKRSASQWVALAFGEPKAHH